MGEVGTDGGALCGSREDEEDRRRLRAELLRLEAEDGPAGTRVERLE